MKNFTKIILWISSILALFSVSYAQEWKRADWWSSPFQVFENVVWEANEGGDGVQKTAINWVTDLEWWYARQYKISNTLDYLRLHIGPYLQRVVYVAFVLSTAWLIIAWFILVTWWIWKTSTSFEKVKSRIINAMLWVFVASGFYIIIKIMMSIVNTFFWD